jgi:ArsR family transcriptional regulator, cadmium/lead-responsive transcriptional repressor
MTRRSVDPVFAALADPTRREVILRLAGSGPSTATGIARDLPVTRQAVAKHLAALQEAGLVTGERVGREHRYRLTPAPLADAVSWMTSVGTQWDERLDRLRRMVERP